MKQTPIVIIIEDDENWQITLSELVSDYFDVQIESFLSFDEAEKRLLNKSKDFDLLITDIFTGDATNSDKGLKFTNFVDKFRNKPVIVVTAADYLINSILNGYKVINAFDKGRFEGMAFVESIDKVIKQKNNVIDNKQIDPNDSIYLA
jgi:DNA-binding NtrC family response regulator